MKQIATVLVATAASLLFPCEYSQNIDSTPGKFAPDQVSPPNAPSTG